VYRAIQELTDMVDGGFGDCYLAHQGMKGTLHNIPQMQAAWLRLEFGDAGEAEVNRILDARKKRTAGWAAADKAQENKGEGSSKKKD
jgi:hypothetical protein